MKVRAPKGTTVAVVGLVSALLFAAHERGVGTATSMAQTTMGAERGSAQIAGLPAPRDNYFPNTESLGADEMRVIALGTGTPNFRRSQATASSLLDG